MIKNLIKIDISLIFLIIVVGSLGYASDNKLKITEFFTFATDVTFWNDLLYFILVMHFVIVLLCISYFLSKQADD